MRLYLEFVRNALQINSTYRLNMFLKLFNRIIGLFISVSIWTALYHGSLVTSSNIGAISLRDMIMYSVLSSVISIFISNNVIGNINDRIKSGQIALDLLKPINFKVWQFCSVVGNNISNIVFELIPILLVAVFVFRFKIPISGNVVLFFISLCNGIVIYFLITYILGILGFWYLEVWHFDRLLQDLVRLFSGAWIPLWFFPQVLISISEYLPFKYIYFAPMMIYLSKVNFDESLIIILLQFGWIVGLLVIEKILWKKGIKKLVIQGG